MSTYRHCQKRTSSADCMDWPKDRTFSILKCFPASLSPQLFNSQFSQTRSNLGCSVIWVAGKGRKKGASVGSVCCNMMWEHSFVLRSGKGGFNPSAEFVRWVDAYPQTLRNTLSQDFRPSGVLYAGTYIDTLTGNFCFRIIWSALEFISE